MKKKIINIAFAGFRHGHIITLYNMAKENPAYKLVGAFESDAADKTAAQEKGVVFTYETYAELLNDPNVDAIALGGYYSQRGPMAIEALKAGKHVIADKPLCTDLEELDKIESLSKEKNLFVSCMFTMRYEKKINAIKKLFESGALGEINNVYFGGQHPLQYGRRPDWYFEDGKHGGVINDIAIHAIDMLAYAFGLQVEEILAARCWNKFASRAPQFKDSAQFMLTAQNSAGIIADVSYAIPDGVEFALPYYWQFSVWGTRGTINFSLCEEKTFYYIAGNDQPIYLKEPEFDTNYLTDFYNLVNGKDGVILPTAEVIQSTRKTLEIQKASI